MISDAEIKRLAYDWQADPMIVDLDYVLGAFLSQMYQQEWANRLRFKGGTCLRKCYFSEYRFSEDLDFTAEDEVSDRDLDALIGTVIQQVQDVFGVNMQARQPRIRLLQDTQGKSTIEVRLYYRGPLLRTGAPQSVRLHITVLGFEHLPPSIEIREINHPYTDFGLLTGPGARCYTLQEILSEKLRALSGQRRFAISRDLFDVYYLLEHGEVDLEDVRNMMEPKFEARSLKLSKVTTSQFISRREEFELDWARNLQHLVPSSTEVVFDKTWAVAVDAIEWVGSLE
jgi:predicted nucleotidyltransferase component of viral defense system